MQERGFLKDRSFDVEAFQRHFDDRPIVAYIGFDLTATSLHVGSLIQLMVLRHLARTGNRSVVLMGDATTRIGDPSDKDTQRPMLDQVTIARNSRSISKLIRNIVPEATFVSNAEWFNGDSPSFMDFVSGYGQHFTINRMLTFDSVKRRLDRKQPLTFLEFTYMLLQAVDFRQLHIKHEVNLQIGGSDQWGNILNGVELIRRMDAAEVFGMTTPLLLDSAGNKMGKTSGKPLWLDAGMTDPFTFFQYWRNVADSDVERFFLLFTDKPVEDIPAGLVDINEAKKELAYLITEIVHGDRAAAGALRMAEAIFERGDTTELPPAATLTQPSKLIDILVAAGLAESKSAARRLVLQNAVSVDSTKVIDPDQLFDQEIIIRAGKKPPVKVTIMGEEE